jgi:Spy/CpxP family protein refolding chaperone
MKTLMQKTLLSLGLLMAIAVGALAQDGPLQGGGDQKRPRANLRRDLFQELGLNPVQRRQIGQLNIGRRPLLQAAQQRFREANQRLDQAIYSDQLNETEVQDRLTEVQLAQAELIRLRSMNELAIRKLLTPDQLLRFRKMRQTFEAMNEGRNGQGYLRSNKADPDTERDE